MISLLDTGDRKPFFYLSTVSVSLFACFSLERQSYFPKVLRYEFTLFKNTIYLIKIISYFSLSSKVDLFDPFAEKGAFGKMIYCIER